VLLVCALALAGQQKPPAEKPREPSEEGKAAEREKARELLDSAAKMITSVQPQVQVTALYHLGDNYNLFDAKKAEEYLEQAFTAAGDLPSGTQSDQRGEMQGQVVNLMADVNLERALALLPQLSPSGGGRDARRAPVDKIARLLVERKDFDRAIQVLESVSGGTVGEYPFQSARLIFEKLAEDDPRRVQVFAAATQGYIARPRGQFGDFLSRHWQAVPRPMAEAALQALLNAVLARKDEETETSTLSTAKGAVSFSSSQDRELFNIMHVVKAIEPKRAAELLETRAELRGGVERFPLGMQSMRSGDSDSMSMSVSQGAPRDSGAVGRERMEAVARARVAEALVMLKEDPQKALAMVRGIPVPRLQAEVLGSVARSVSDKDPATAKSVLDQTIHILDGIKNPSERGHIWTIVAEAAFRAKEEERAWEAIDRGLSDAAEMYKKDADVEFGNSALREYWPSTQAYRRMVHQAAKLFGVKAEGLLVKITDPELALLARLEIAQSLLGRPTSANQIRISGRGREEQMQQQRR
jgi:hypothetical protein